MEFRVPDAVAVLKRTPGALEAMLRGQSDAWVHSNEGAGTFSVFDNVGHLLHGERTDWIPRARIILEQGPDRTFPTFDRYAHVHESQGRTLDELLQDFGSLRTQSLRTLEEWELTDSELDLEGNHPTFGPVSLRQLLSTWTAHDLGHIAQIARVMAKQYREEVGPWREFLPIMDRR